LAAPFSFATHPARQRVGGGSVDRCRDFLLSSKTVRSRTEKESIEVAARAPLSGSAHDGIVDFFIDDLWPATKWQPF
jgi:hypothetical protein